VIEINKVSKWYGSFQVLTNCTTSVKKGEVVVVCGPSGSGKSTLIKTVNMLEPFQEGTITVDGISVGAKGTDLPKLRSRVGMVFQNFELFPHLTITENLTLAQIKVLGPFQGRGDCQRFGFVGPCGFESAGREVSRTIVGWSATASCNRTSFVDGPYLHVV
jgi:glutamate/aspartate transport system ATP-binding protein